MGKYTIFSLEGCPYSMSAENLFKKLNNKNKYTIQRVSNYEKDKFKNNTEHPMTTFPQIYYKRGNDTIILGGLSDLQQWIDDKNYLKVVKNPNEKKNLYILRKSINKHFK